MISHHLLALSFPSQIIIMSNFNNSAKELLNIVLAFKHFFSNNKLGEKNINLSDGWVSVFNIDNPDEDHDAFFNAIQHVRALYHDVTQMISFLPEIESEEFINLLRPIEKMLNPYNMRYRWSNLDTYITDGMIGSLDGLASKIELNYQRLISDSNYELNNDGSDLTIEELQINIESLINDIIQSDIELGLRNFILDNLDVIRTAILEYRNVGHIGLRSTAEIVIGRFTMYSGSIERNINDDYWSKIKSICISTSRYILLNDNIWGLLGGGTPRLLQ